MADIVALKTPRRRNPAETRAAILQAAMELMAERGPEALRVSDVAHAAGVNRTTAYQHFRTRDDIIGAVMADVADRISRQIEENRERPELIEEMIRYFADHPEVARLWMYQLLSDIPSENRSGWERYMSGFEAFANSDRALPGIDSEMLATLLLAATLGWSLVLYRDVEDDEARASYVDRFAAEMKRLLLFGAMRPEAWPSLVRDVEASRRRSAAKKPDPTKRET